MSGFSFKYRVKFSSENGLNTYTISPHGTCLAPLAGPSAIATESAMRDLVTETDLRPSAKYPPNPFSSFAGDAPQTDRQTCKLNIARIMRR